MEISNPDQDPSPFPSIIIGIIAYNSEKYLPHCLKSLAEQTFRNFRVVVQDNTEGKSGDSRWIRENYPDISVIESKNVGFAKAHNNIIRNTQSNYYLAANPDMIFEKTFLEELFKVIDNDVSIGSATGKILRWDFENCEEKNSGKTNIIDSTGLRFLQNHRFEDRGQGQKDDGQYDDKTEIFGVSGAAGLYWRDALDDVAFIQKDGTREYFDELMYMYKEDVDLAYRLQWAGYRSIYAPKAIAYHDRTTESAGTKHTMRNVLRSRKGRSKQIKKWSYLNHQIMLRKNMSPEFSRKVIKGTRWYQWVTHAYIFFREPFLLRERVKLRMLRHQIREKRAQTKRHITPNEMEKIMEKH